MSRLFAAGMDDQNILPGNAMLLQLPNLIQHPRHLILFAGQRDDDGPHPMRHIEDVGYDDFLLIMGQARAVEQRGKIQDFMRRRAMFVPMLTGFTTYSIACIILSEAVVVLPSLVLLNPYCGLFNRFLQLPVSGN
jgi:hypothetical protein